MGLVDQDKQMGKEGDSLKKQKTKKGRMKISELKEKLNIPKDHKILNSKEWTFSRMDEPIFRLAHHMANEFLKLEKEIFKKETKKHGHPLGAFTETGNGLISDFDLIAFIHDLMACLGLSNQIETAFYEKIKFTLFESMVRRSVRDRKNWTERAESSEASREHMREKFWGKDFKSVERLVKPKRKRAY